jgi:hypothetical protein
MNQLSYGHPIAQLLLIAVGILLALGMVWYAIWG